MAIPESPPKVVEGQCRAKARAEEAAGAAATDLPSALLAGTPPPDYLEKTMARLLLAAGVKSMGEVGNLLQWAPGNEDEDKAEVAVEFTARFMILLRISPLFVFFGTPPMHIPLTTPLRESEIEETLMMLFRQEPVRRWKEAGYSVGSLLSAARCL